MESKGNNKITIKRTVCKEKSNNIYQGESKRFAKTLEESAYGTPRLLNPPSCDET